MNYSLLRSTVLKYLKGYGHKLPCLNTIILCERHSLTTSVIIIISHFTVRKGSGMSRHLKSDHDRGG